MGFNVARKKAGLLELELCVEPPLDSLKHPNQFLSSAAQKLSTSWIVPLACEFVGLRSTITKMCDLSELCLFGRLRKVNINICMRSVLSCGRYACRHFGRQFLYCALCMCILVIFIIAYSKFRMEIRIGFTEKSQLLQSRTATADFLY